MEFFKELENSILVNFRGVGDLEVPNVPNSYYHFSWQIWQNRQFLCFQVTLLQTRFGYLEVLNIPNSPSPNILTGRFGRFGEIDRMGIFGIFSGMGQHTFKNVSNCLNINIYSYLVTAGG
jgi:hypothetical protein